MYFVNCAEGAFLKPLFLYFLFIILKSSLGTMAYNVPVVYDVFAVAIKKREAFPATAKMCWSESWEA
jgi:hypothetical protein